MEEFPGGAAGAFGEGGPEPRVGLGDVVGHDVDDGADAVPGGLRDELLGLGEGAEGGVDGPVVGDVVAAVGHRGGVPGVEPEGVDAELGEVGQLGADTGEVSGAVAVGVGETAYVHLVDDGRAPPVRVRHGGSFRACGGRAGFSP